MTVRSNPKSLASNRLLRIETEGTQLCLRVAGVWSLRDGLCPIGPLADAVAKGEISLVQVSTSELEQADSSLAVFLSAVHDLCTERQIALDLSLTDAGIAKLVSLARSVPKTTVDERRIVPHSKMEHVGHWTLNILREADRQLHFFGEMALSIGRFVRGQACLRGRDVWEVMEDAGPRSLIIVGVISLLLGMILAFIGAVQLRRFGAGLYVADLVGLAVTREMAAVMTGIVIAGQTGAAFAARIGTMQTQEEVDALTTLGVSPMDFLVLPRVIGLALMMPLLYLYACAVGLLGGMMIGTSVFDLSVLQYWQQTQWALRPVQFVIGFSKSVVFGVLVAMAGCMRGIQCGRSAAAVGAATTSAVVTSILYIILTDAIFAVVLEVYGL